MEDDFSLPFKTSISKIPSAGLALALQNGGDSKSTYVSCDHPLSCHGILFFSISNPSLSTFNYSNWFLFEDGAKCIGWHDGKTIQYAQSIGRSFE